MKRAQYAALGLRMGLTYTETFEITPGELFDLAELNRGRKRTEDD